MFALINNDKFTLVGKFDSIEGAEKVGKAAKYDFSIVGSAGDLSIYAPKDIVTLYNNLGGTPVKKFENKGKAQQRLWLGIEAADVKAVNPPKKERASTGKSTVLMDETPLKATPVEGKRWRKGTSRSQINTFIEEQKKTSVGKVVEWALKNKICENRGQVISCINKLAGHPTAPTVAVS